MKLRFHLLPNAHLDPVWLWDWREGLNEGLITIRTVLDLMDEVPHLTFVRGESAIYGHIERTDKPTFRRIERMIQKGRWDVVGGTVIQPDSNLTGTEVLCREFEIAQKYFTSRFGRCPNVAWQADSFSHTPGWPNILQAFGMDAFVFTRPQRTEFALESPVFHWKGTGSNKLLCYRQHWKWYCSERDNVIKVLNLTLDKARNSSWRNVGILIGLGNHGGGPTRRILADVEHWEAEHPDVEVVYSTLHSFIAELRKEATGQTIPVVKDDLGYCLRGCYSSVQKFKTQFRQTEALLGNAQISQALLGAAFGVGEKERVDLGEAWHSLCFNAFHDVLPGTSIERAYDDQSAWVGLAMHRARQAQLEALNWLGSEVNTSVDEPQQPDLPRDVPILVWNPLARTFNGSIELEASLDYRPIWQYENRQHELPIIVSDAEGKDLPFQQIPTEHRSLQTVPWRARVVVPLKIPAWGWQVVRLGWRDKKPRSHVQVSDPVIGYPKTKQIESSRWKIQVKAGKLRIIDSKYPALFSKTEPIRLRLFEDIWGSWGGMEEERDSYRLNNLLETFRVTASAILETGPIRSSLWVRWEGKRSWVELTFRLTSADEWIAIDGRMLLNERSARLKLTFPCRGTVSCDMPGGTISDRRVDGQHPVGRWITRTHEDLMFGIASDVLSDCDFTPSELSLTLARATRYADDVPTKAKDKPWLPAVDCGELKFRLIMFSRGVLPEEASNSLLSPPLTAHVAPSAGKLAPSGQLGTLTPESLRLLSVETTKDKSLQVRVQNLGKKAATPRLRFLNRKWKLESIRPQEIKMYQLKI